MSVVIVNYGSWPDVSRLVSSLLGSGDVASGLAEVIVVDNASPGPRPDALLRPTVGLRVVLRPENGGFSAGVNAGWRASSAPWLLILNPDIVAAPDLIRRVTGRIDAYQGRPGGPPGVVGFALRNEDGTKQPSVGVFPGLVRTAWEQLIPRHRRKYQPEWRLRAGPVDWVTGACMLVNRRAFDDLGGMDEDFFLYHEEVALCRSASRRGWRVEYDPAVSVVHLHPLQNRPISPKMRVITRHSKLLYFRKHLPAWQFRALGAGVRWEARVRGAIARAKGRTAEARSWRAVDRVARLLGEGVDLGGRGVLALAEAAVEESAEEGEWQGPRVRHQGRGDRHPPTRFPGTSHGTRPVPLRKDGPA